MASFACRVLTFFTSGFNIAEAVNFASLRWVPFGLKAKVTNSMRPSFLLAAPIELHGVNSLILIILLTVATQVCKCSPDSVRIDMDAFLVKLFDSSDGSKNQTTDALSEDAWVFSCTCNKYYSSENQKYTVEVRAHTYVPDWLNCLLRWLMARYVCIVVAETIQDQWFECSTCKIWAHVGCIQPDLVHLKVRFAGRLDPDIKKKNPERSIMM